ncbi:MAG: hypothetical protein ACXW5U_29160 [Thermoanaerobaculia bacterium]
MFGQVLNNLVDSREYREVDLASLHEIHERTDNLGTRDRPVVPKTHEHTHNVEIGDVALLHRDGDL